MACVSNTLTLNLLTTNIVAPPSNASKWQMGFNSAFKGMHEKTNKYTNYSFSLLIMYGSSYVSALHCNLKEAFLVPSERCSIEEQSIEYCGWAYCLVTWCAERTTSLDTTRHIHNILSTAP